MNFAIGTVMIIFGLLMVVFFEPIYSFTGPIAFAERYSAGSSRNFIKLIGAVLIILGIIVFSGIWIYIALPLQSWLRSIFRIN